MTISQKRQEKNLVLYPSLSQGTPNDFSPKAHLQIKIWQYKFFLTLKLKLFATLLFLEINSISKICNANYFIGRH